MPDDPVTDADRATAKNLVARVLMDIAAGTFDERTPAYREAEVAAALTTVRAEEREMCARMMDQSADAATSDTVAFTYEHAAEAIRAAAGANRRLLRDTRERCAETCDRVADDAGRSVPDDQWDEQHQKGVVIGARRCAAAIRGPAPAPKEGA